MSFGGDNSIIGDFSFAFLKNVGFAPVDYAPTIPHQLFMMFQLAFAIISGSVAERMKFPVYLAFVLLWSTLVYDPIAHWVWGNGGWIREMGALDFAGGTVIHVSPFSALLIGFVGGILCFFAVTELKKRFGYDDALDAFGCHGVGGIWGGISAGIFATSTINPDITGGLVDGNAGLLIAEIVSILAVTAYSAVVSFVIHSLHGETAYGSVSAAGLAVGAHEPVAIPASPSISPKSSLVQK